MFNGSASSFLSWVSRYDTCVLAAVDGGIAVSRIPVPGTWYEAIISHIGQLTYRSDHLHFIMILILQGIYIPDLYAQSHVTGWEPYN